MKRLTKEYNLDICRHIQVKYGTINRENPEVIYVNGKCWVMPLEESDYKDVIHGIERNLRKNINLFLMDDEHFKKKYILDFDINTDTFNVNEKKFLSFDLYLRQNNVIPIKNLKGILEKKLSTIVNNLVYHFSENDFIVQKKK